MRKIIAFFVLMALVLALSGCESHPQTTTAPTETVSALELKFQEKLALLTEYIEEKTLYGEDMSTADPSQVYQFLYSSFLEVAEHPGAQIYLSRFVMDEDVALSVYYSTGYTQYYGYDSEGRLIQEPIVSGNSLHLMEYTYSDLNVYHGKVSSAQEYIVNENADKFVLNRYNYSYHANGNLKRIAADGYTELYDEDGRLYQKVVDSNAWITGSYISSYTQTIRTDYHYDADGVLTDSVETTIHTSVNSDIPELDFCYTYESVTTYTYDENGRLVGTNSINYNKTRTQETWEYDDAGTLDCYVKDTYYEDEWRMSAGTTYTYDESGRLLKAENWERYAYQDETYWNSTLEYTYGNYCRYYEE